MTVRHRLPVDPSGFEHQIHGDFVVDRFEYRRLLSVLSRHGKTDEVGDGNFALDGRPVMVPCRQRCGLRWLAVREVTKFVCPRDRR